MTNELRALEEVERSLVLMLSMRDLLKPAAIPLVHAQLDRVRVKVKTIRNNEHGGTV